MKHLRETFTDQEFERLKYVKSEITVKGKCFSWHDAIIEAFDAWATKNYV